ncbi:hypothetical protein, unlikely [Trypanosoma brucei gambiense DAL972]|uniref:Uncharacterized protein n=1 Tax=Trypanosoma brucei gambiense (strain MHOM/CI/86/DAL972) TaxID=679716 RepID=C9ZTU9_TRYB9|nr:hypothetical protein, unlikely [Trypanosoma brucei gambiense DAL972]CBH12835.1 hypothetical protein, unlikely [Trypanosoma brucei gambiense DAL972]|eukprot:XP_011775114.1 hypothetical protein, unlikely [Trypanosoma brucei gambiense DAL972]
MHTESYICFLEPTPLTFVFFFLHFVPRSGGTRSARSSLFRLFGGGTCVQICVWCVAEKVFVGHLVLNSPFPTFINMFLSSGQELREAPWKGGGKGRLESNLFNLFLFFL